MQPLQLCDHEKVATLNYVSGQTGYKVILAINKAEHLVMKPRSYCNWLCIAECSICS